MKVRDVMKADMITLAPATPATPVATVAETLANRGVSGAPVVPDFGALLPVVSESDLIRREEIGTDRERSWWVGPVSGSDGRVRTYVKEHGATAGDVTTSRAVTNGPEASLSEAARRRESRRIKRLPVGEVGRLVGIVSRADPLRGLAVAAPATAEPTLDDRALRERVLDRLRGAGVIVDMVGAVAQEGRLALWGVAQDDAEERAAQVAAESALGVTEVETHIGRVPSQAFGVQAKAARSDPAPSRRCRSVGDIGIRGVPPAALE